MNINQCKFNVNVVFLLTNLPSFGRLKSTCRFYLQKISFQKNTLLVDSACIEKNAQTVKLVMSFLSGHIRVKLFLKEEFLLDHTTSNFLEKINDKVS